jgi:hypothetical protein
MTSTATEQYEFTLTWTFDCHRQTSFGRGPIPSSSTGSTTTTTQEMSVRVELPEGVARECLREWWPLAIRNGWRDTVDRLADALAAHAVG